MAKKPKAPTPEAPAVSEQPCYLQRAHIKDFRSIRDAKVEFKPGLNIIIGANGSGKTNFVRVVSRGSDLNKGNDGYFASGTTFNLAGRNNLEIKYLKDKHLVHRVNHRQIIGESIAQEVLVSTDDGSISKGDSLFNALLNNSALRYAYTDFISSEIIFVRHGTPQPYLLADAPFDIRHTI